MKFYKAVSIVGISMLWAGTNLAAQNVADSLHQLPEVVITEKYDDREIRSSAPLQILTKQTLQNLNVLQVSDAVKFFSGVNVKDYGGIGGLKTVSVRSLGAAHTSVSYNGIPLSDAQTGQIDIGNFRSIMLKRLPSAWDKTIRSLCRHACLPQPLHSIFARLCLPSKITGNFRVKHLLKVARSDYSILHSTSLNIFQIA
jgi:hypothetical protein